MSSDPFVDVVIAVHDERRRVDRAVASLAADGVRVTVVCHGIPAESVSQSLPPAGDALRVVAFSDGIPSPSGPFNHGLSLATAPYVMIMGSDDFVEPGALSAWTEVVRRSGADILLAPLRHQDGALLANPLARPWRRRSLDPVRDRLFYRTAPLGLIRRELAAPPGPLSVGMPVGGDLAWSTALWTSGRRIDFDERLPAYVIGADADVRVTLAPRAVDVVLAPVDALLGSPWAAEQPERIRRSLVAKLLRVNVLGALRSRPDESAWPDEARTAMAATIRALARYAPRGAEDLPRGDRDLLDVAGSSEASAASLAAAVARYRGVGRVGRLLPRRLTRAFGRESVLRRYARYALNGGRR